MGAIFLRHPRQRQPITAQIGARPAGP